MEIIKSKNQSSRKQKIRENQWNQNWPFEKIKKIIKSLARVIKKKKGHKFPILGVEEGAHHRP